MTYSEWLREVDQAFEAAGRRLRVSAINPSMLLEAFDKGTRPAAFVESTPSALDWTMAQPSVTSGTLGGVSFFRGLSDLKAINDIDLPRAALVARCLSILGWVFVGLSAVVVLVWLAVSVAALFGTTQVESTLNGMGGRVESRSVAAFAGFSTLGGLLSGISVFLVGIFCWWAEAMLKGLYRLLGNQGA